MNHATFPFAIALSFVSTTLFAGNALHIGQRSVTQEGSTLVEPNYQDEQGREVYLRGWNVSGSVKLASQGFKPFLSKQDAAKSFELMRRNTGANFVRFTLAWEGVNPAPEQIDYAYLDALIEQMREAFKQHIYIFLDFHTDLYSRYLFTENSSYTGNGAPEWIIKGGQYPPSACAPVCVVWGQSLTSNPAVRLAYRNFYDNAPIQTAVGERHVQDEFIWQLKQVLGYLKQQLTPEEFEWVTGVQPMNEPLYGHGHTDFASEFDNEKLWPFYQRVRTVMNDQGWQKKWVYAEPMVFWDANAGFILPPTGGHYLTQKPGDGFVFAPHFYDQARIGIATLSRVYNGEYFKNFDDIRSEARFLGLPMLVGEFGMSLKDQNGGAKDYVRIVHGVYQSLESSDINHEKKDRRPDFYTALIPSTQWHWDIYKDNHHEYQNGNPTKLKTSGDGWNGEDFSAIKGDTLTVNPNVIQRAYPRFVDGNIISFYYNDLAQDGAGKLLDWAEIKTDTASYFADKNFALLIWQGGKGLNSEIFLPPVFDPAKTTLITETSINVSSNLTPEFSAGVTGYQLEIPTATGANLTGNFHFALIINNADQSNETLQLLQQQLIAQVNKQQNPLYFRGRMRGLDYPDESGVPNAVQLDASEYHFLYWRWLKLNWKASGPVTIFQKDNSVRQGGETGTARFFSIVGHNDTFQICEKNAPSNCSKKLYFD